MTEYNYDPAAMQRHIYKQQTVGRWAADNARYTPANPFSPKSLAGTVLADDNAVYEHRCITEVMESRARPMPPMRSQTAPFPVSRQTSADRYQHVRPGYPPVPMASMIGIPPVYVQNPMRPSCTPPYQSLPPITRIPSAPRIRHPPPVVYPLPPPIIVQSKPSGSSSLKTSRHKLTSRSTPQLVDRSWYKPAREGMHRDPQVIYTPAPPKTATDKKPLGQRVRALLGIDKPRQRAQTIQQPRHGELSRRDNIVVYESDSSHHSRRHRSRDRDREHRRDRHHHSSRNGHHHSRDQSRRRSRSRHHHERDDRRREHRSRSRHRSRARSR